MRRSTAILATTAASALAVSVVTVAPAASAKGDQVKMRGDCSASSDWKVKVKTKKGQLRTDFWVKNNAVGQEWTYRLTAVGDPGAGRKSTRANDDAQGDDSAHTAEVKFRSWASRYPGPWCSSRRPAARPARSPSASGAPLAAVGLEAYL